MKNLLMLAILFVGTTAMVNAQQVEPAKKADKKEVKVKKVEKKADKKVEEVKAMEPAKK